MPPSEFEPTVSASEQPQTYILDLAAPDTGHEEPNSAIVQTNQIATY